MAPALTGDRRKTVTVLFCDIVGSTALGERVDPEVHREVLRRYYTGMRSVLEKHGGTVEKFIGDAVMAVFGAPVAHEDDALRAVRAAADMQQTVRAMSADLLSAYGVELAVRIGVNTGEVVTTADAHEGLVTGDAVNVAARLEQAAAPGEVLLGDATMRLVCDGVQLAPIEPVVAKGKARPLETWRLTSMTPPADGQQHLHEPAFVGREHELRLLRDALERSVDERTCHVVTLLGDPGVGKSRLLSQFLSTLPPEVLAVEGQCLAYGDGAAWHPLQQVLRAVASIGDDDANVARRKLADTVADATTRADITELLAPVAGIAGHVGDPTEIAAAIRFWLEGLAASRPVVIVVDDVHWARGPLLEVLSGAARQMRKVPVLFVCVGRPEFIGEHSDWLRGVRDATLLYLTPLHDDQVDRLVMSLLGSAPVDARVTVAVDQVAGGNPLFVRQLVAMLRDQDRIVHVDGRWRPRGSLDHLGLPPSIAALLAARLDQLEAAQHDVIAAASVAGLVFHPDAVAELIAGDGASVRGTLLELERKDLVEPAEPDRDGSDAFRFTHVLMRDAAYRELPKSDRSHLHEVYASWLRRHPSLVPDLDQVVAHHLERAVALRTELGPLDLAGRELAADAACCLAAAARATILADPSGALEMLRRAEVCCDDRRARLAMIRDEAYALFRLGRIGEARRILDDAAEEAERNGHATLALTARLLAFWYAVNVDIDVPHADVDRQCREVLATVEPDAESELYLAAAAARMQVLSIGARRDEMFQLADQALPYAVTTGDQATEARLRMAWYHSLVLGSVPAPDALEECERMAASVHPDALTAVTQLDFRTARATLLAMVGREHEARQLIAEQATVVEAFGSATGAVEFDLAALEVDQVLGDEDALAARYQRALAWMTDHDEHGWHSFYAVDYAVRLFERLSDAEVARLVDTARGEAYPDDVAVQATWRTAEALRHSRCGRHADAVRLAAEARAWALRGQMPAWRAALELRCADVLIAAGDHPSAVDAVTIAVDLFRGKGDVPEQRRASARREALAAKG